MNSIPGCIGYHGKPTGENKCESCKYVDLCKRVVHKDRLKSVLEAIEKIEADLKG